MALATETALCDNLVTEIPEPPVALPPAEVSGLSESAVTDVAPVFQSICDLEAAMLRLPQVEVPLQHDFCNGLYARSIAIPAGCLITGAVHRSESFWVVRSGELAFTNENGEAMVASAGAMGRTPAGVKRAGLALTDCVFTTFHANPDNELDTDKLWIRYTVEPSREAIEAAHQGALQ